MYAKFRTNDSRPDRLLTWKNSRAQPKDSFPPSGTPSLASRASATTNKMPFAARLDHPIPFTPSRRENGRLEKNRQSSRMLSTSRAPVMA